MNSLKEYRAKAKLTQQKLADQSGVTRFTINRLERGAFPMTMKVAKKLSPALNCKPEELIGDDNIRALLIVQEKGKEPTFKEALKGFINSYGRKYHDCAISKDGYTPVFYDEESKRLYKTLKELVCTMDRKSYEKVLDTIQGFIDKKQG